jgi:hypothetical protein
MNSDGGAGKTEEEEDDDFPEYANEQNKELNEIVNPYHKHRSKKKDALSRTYLERLRRRTTESPCCLTT